MAELTLLGYRYSIYTRVLRILLAEKGLNADYVETVPFAETPDPALRAGRR